MGSAEPPRGLAIGGCRATTGTPTGAAVPPTAHSVGTARLGRVQRPWGPLYRASSPGPSEQRAESLAWSVVSSQTAQRSVFCTGCKNRATSQPSSPQRCIPVTPALSQNKRAHTEKKLGAAARREASWRKPQTSTAQVGRQHHIRGEPAQIPRNKVCQQDAESSADRSLFVCAGDEVSP